MNDGITSIPLWDHHCHALVGGGRGLGSEMLARALSEAPPGYPLADLVHTVPYRQALALAAERLQCAPEAGAVEQALAARDYGQYCADLFREAGYHALCMDTGYAPGGAMSPDEIEKALGVAVFRILRLETMAQEHLARGLSFGEWLEAVRTSLRGARADGFVGVKSIIAYRSGLRVEPPWRKEAEAAYQAMLESGATRLQDAALLNFLLWEMTPTLIDQALPLQFHTGFGDPDTDLYKGNPLLLREYLEAFLPRGHRVALLHTYPYHREAGWLASVYPGVYLDVSLALPLAASGGARILQEALELAPLSRVLFASDSHSRPESFFIAARLWRDGLEAFLDRAVRDHHVLPSVVEHWAELVLAQNCRTVYGI
jgi:predicted TIM-barrel fold metal-dependent hydrolase